MSIPDEHELQALLQQMKKDPSPGPDGLNVAFYRTAWSWIKEDVTALLQDFYNTGHLHRDLN